MEMADNGAGRWSLVELLHILTQKHGSPARQSERNAAAKQLMSDIEGWAKAVVWKKLGKSLRALPSHEARGMVSAAIQALAIAASTANEPFAGNSELAARAWCRRVMLNHVTSETLDEQLFVLDLKAGGGDERRQKNLVYKLRERGRKALRAAYGFEQDD